jgi:hypothetical protein
MMRAKSISRASGTIVRRGASVLESGQVFSARRRSAIALGAFGVKTALDP